MVTGAEQSVAEFLGPGREAMLRPANPGDVGDGRSCEIAAGACERGISVGLEKGQGLLGEFNPNVAALNMQAGMARPAGWMPEVAPELPNAEVKTTLDI